MFSCDVLQPPSWFGLRHTTLGLVTVATRKRILFKTPYCLSFYLGIPRLLYVGGGASGAGNDDAGAGNDAVGGNAGSVLKPP